MSSEFPVENPSQAAEQLEQQSLLRRLAPKAGAAALVASSFLGMAAGAEVAMEASPTVVTFAPGVSAEVALRRDVTSISTGADLRLNLPAATARTPLGAFGADIRLNTVTVPIDESNPQGLAVYAALGQQRDKAVIEPVRNALIHKGVEGAGLVGAGELLGVSLLLGYTRRRRRANALAQKVAALGEEIDKSDSGQNQLRTAFENIQAAATKNTHTNWRTFVTPAISAGLAGVSLIGLAQPLYAQRAPGNPQALDPSITRLAPVLSGATIEGTSGKALINGIINYKKDVDDYWKRVNNNFDLAFNDFVTKGGLDYRNSPDVVPALAVSDIHGNFAFLNGSFGHFVNKFNVPLVLDLGDTYVSVNKLPGEENIMKTMLNQLRPSKQNGRKVVEVKVSGNHDPTILPANIVNTTFTDASGENYRPLITLDANHPVTTVDGLTFAGWSDGRQSIMGEGTTPTDGEAQNKLLARDGKHLADAACDIKLQNSIAPIVLAHAKEATFEALSKGCASTALVGHTHVTSGPFSIAAQDGTALQFTNGTSSGAGENQFTEYARITKPEGAELILLLFSKTTNQLTQTVSVTVKPNGSVLLHNDRTAKAPINVPMQNRIRNFLSQYSPDAIVPSVQPSANTSAR